MRLTAMPHPDLPFNGHHPRDPCKLHGSLLIYRPRGDGRLSWPSWLTHSGRLTHEVVTRQPYGCTRQAMTIFVNALSDWQHNFIGYDQILCLAHIANV